MILTRRRRDVLSLAIAIFLVIDPSSFLVTSKPAFSQLQRVTIFLRGGAFSDVPLDEISIKSFEEIKEKKEISGSSEIIFEEASSVLVGDVHCEQQAARARSDGTTELHPKRTSADIPSKRKHASDLIHKLHEESLSLDSMELRDLISSRTNDYIQQLQESATDQKLQDPKKLLHYLAPKIPAIKHSPDIALRIQAARSDIDPGIAACLLGVLGHVCELYDKKITSVNQQLDDNGKYEPIAAQLVKDRRLEQLLECVLCGVNVKRRTEEFTKQSLDHEARLDCIEEILDTEHVQITGGLSIRDASRAAWGIAILGLHEVETIGDEKVEDLLIALSLRVRELLLARLQALRQDDLAWVEGLSEQDTLAALSEDLASDTASVAWAFACVRACTGIRFSPLLEVCCSILCQDPFELRRRAQELESVIKTGNIGMNDAVERLARADADETNGQKKVAEAGGRTTDIETGVLHSLTDWLEPNELTDVIWAVALHGRSDIVNQDEEALSETTTAFREVAFDRLLVWLKEELENLRVGEQAENYPNCPEQMAISHPSLQETGENLSMKLVDAEGLLQVEGEDAIPSKASKTDEPWPIQLVDAATLLQSEKNALEAAMHIEASSVLQTRDATRMVERAQVAVFDTSGNEPPSMVPPYGETTPNAALSGETARIFSDHDLCSIVWTATELQDPLRDTVIETIVKIFFRLGTDCLWRLAPADLSNLSWGIAKKASENDFEDVDRALSLCTTIARTVLSMNQLTADDITSGQGIGQFQPPELSRLVWATATAHTCARSLSKLELETLQLLSQNALLTAADNLQVYCAEDVTRIVWGYLELSDKESTITANANAISEALGRSLAAIEAALHQWETCSEMSAKTDGVSQSTREPLKFGSFFGKSTTMLLDYQRLEQEFTHDSDEISGITRRPRPVLKDLPVDPSTLCKFLCSLAKLKFSNTRIKGGESLMRIALSLLSSKNGRLLRECPLFDLARLCGAIAEVDSTNNCERTAHFVRRVVQFLNEAPSGYDLVIAPAESVKLLWALGQLGVTFNIAGRSHSDTAHRRLELVSDASFLITTQFCELTDRRVAKLLRGIVTTNLLAAEMEYANEVIQHTRTRVKSDCTVAFLCDLTETIGLLNEAMRDAQEFYTFPVKEPSRQEINGRNASDDIAIDTSTFLSLLTSTEKLMKKVAKYTTPRLDGMSVVDLRRVLSVYAFASIRADDVVNEIEKIVKSRRAFLIGKLNSGTELKSVLTDMVDHVQQIRKATKSDSDSALTSFSSSLKSFFRRRSSAETLTEIPLGIEGMDDEIAVGIDTVLRSVTEISHFHERIDFASGTSLTKTINDIVQATLFELGRCSELIDHYRRIDFVTGRRRSRLDLERRRDMTKRLLSRVLP